jgi:lipopolysaccharide/colanic/teichoic acid biosynthesis glycosyltransferase
MSMVGPRPERPHFVQQLEQIPLPAAAHHQAWDNRMGSDQLWVRKLIDHAIVKFQYDLFYIKNMSRMLMD